MKYFLLSLFLLSGAVIVTAQPHRFLTYNIRLDVASDGENAWPKRQDYLAAQIHFYAPDVFGIQEGLPHQVEYLQENLPQYASFGEGREGGKKGESTHIFYLKSRYEAEQQRVFWLSATPDTVSMGWDAACLRVCTAVLLKEKASGRRFWVFNTHLDHMGKVARIQSAELMLAKAKTFNADNLPVILMGDMNSEPDSEVIAKLRSEMLDARDLSIEPPFGPSGTFNGFKFDQPVTLLIDYIFASKNSAFTVNKFAVLSDSKDLRYPSDHLPVMADLEWK